MKRVNYLILGGGVSGLAFANHIKSDDYVIIEKESEPGGYCRTTKRNGFVWDFAGHFFHFSHPELKQVFESITVSNQTVSRIKNTKIFYKDYYVDYPFQKNIHQLSKEEMIDCLYGLFTKVEKENYDNFLEMLYGKFGEGITNKFLLPYNEKLYACSLNYLDVDAMGRFFPYADIKNIIQNMRHSDNSSYNQTFLYPRDGASVYVQKLLDGIQTNNIHYCEEATKINTEKKTLETDKETYSYNYLISSIPLNHFCKISDLKEITDPSVFSYNQVLVFNLGFDSPSIDKTIHWIYVPSKDINFYRVGFYNNIIGSERLSLYIEIGYSKDAVISQEEIQKQLAKTLDGLSKIGIIKQHKLVDYQSIVMNPAYVHITKKSIKETAKIRSILEKRNAYIIGRYGDWKYCSIEDCMVDSIAAYNRINNIS